MDHLEYLIILNRKKTTVFSIALIFILLMAAAMAAMPWKYESRSQILILQSFKNGIDPYVALKTNEYLGGLIVNVISSSSFVKDAAQAGFNIDQNYFGDGEEAQIKKWNKTVEAAALRDSGVVAVRVYHPDREQAEQISLAVNQALRANLNSYVGGGNVSVRVIDAPIVSRYPVRPNIILNLILAAVIGLIAALSYVYFFPEKRYDIRLWPKKKSGSGEYAGAPVEYSRPGGVIEEPRIEAKKEPARQEKWDAGLYDGNAAEAADDVQDQDNQPGEIKNRKSGNVPENGKQEDKRIYNWEGDMKNIL